MKTQNWKVIKTKEDYEAALARAVELFHVEENTPESDELDLLLVLIKDYEDKNIHLPSADPLEVIKLKLDEKNLKMKDLEPIIGSKGHVSAILSGKRELTLGIVKKLHKFLGIPAGIFLKAN